MRIRRIVACASACAGLLVMAGCAITNYSVITDNDQVSNGQGTGIVNTSGSAFLRAKQIVVEWPDGTDNLLNFVDQASNGDRTLRTYNNFSTGSDPVYVDNLYCSPEHQGCAVTVAEDPEIGDVDIFDYTLNANCTGARSLSILLSTDRYYGECGRTTRPSLSDRLSLLYMGKPIARHGIAGLAWDATPATTTIHLDNLAGDRTLLPLAGEIPIAMLAHGTRQASVDLTSPALKAMGDAFANWAQTRASHENEIVVTYNGIEFRKTFGLVKDPGKKIRGILNAKY